MDELISVIVPVYKVKKFLNRCVDSIINQTYKNLEIILVDDGCPEGCGDICDEYAKIDNRVKVIHKDNGGLSDARNYGLDFATGEYITFVDSDDYVECNYCELLYETLKKERADLSICSFVEVNIDGTELINSKKQMLENCVCNKDEFFQNFFEHLKVEYIITCAKLYHRQIFDNLRFDVGKIHEDEFIFHKIIDRCNKIALISERLYNYVRHNSSITGVAKSHKNLDFLEALIYRANYFNHIDKIDLANKTKIKFLSYFLDFNVILKKDKAAQRRIKEIIKIYRKTLGKDSYYMKVQLRRLIIIFKLQRILATFKKIIYKIKNIKMFAGISKELKSIRKYGTLYIFISVPTHGNLGDQAIVYAQHNLLKSLNLDKQTYEFENEFYLEHKEKIAKLIKKDDVIIIDGGGNIGTLWIKVEEKMRDIITRFKDNKVIIFPNTAYFGDNENGRKELKKSVEIYSEHKNLHIFTREELSYKIMRENFAINNIYLSPDIVLFLDNLKFTQSRKNILLCFRQDKEKVFNSAQLSELENYLKDKHYKFNHISTVIRKSVYRNERERILMRFWQELASSELVITDRLHAMIFCAITATPCIALDNLSNKVKNCYKWIEDLPYIKFCNSLTEVLENIDAVVANEKCMYNIDSKHFNELRSVLR